MFEINIVLYVFILHTREFEDNLLELLCLFTMWGLGTNSGYQT